jgi:sulfate adenylyltransferase subunit 1
VEQTARHSFIASLLGIKHVVYCINKMDLVDYSKERFEEIKDQLDDFTSKLEVSDIRYIPISALLGDNVVDRSKKMPWYDGSTLLYTLETVHIASDANHVDCRFPVQTVIRPQTTEFHDYRGYAGRVAGGIFKKGDEVMVLPSGFTSKVAKIDTFDGEVEEAFPPMSCTILLEDDIDVSRGDMIVRVNNQPDISQDHEMMICWMSQRPLQLNGKYAIKHTTRSGRCIVKDIRYKVDINTLHRLEEDKNIKMNDIARITIRTTVPLFTDRYQRNRNTGSIILIDESTNETVGAGMIL